MDILTFDVEEWYMEKILRGGREFKYQQFDETFAQLMDKLDMIGLKATFFCVGQLAIEFPDVVKTIASKGHEIGCHSNIHSFLNKMDEQTLRQDTAEAIKALEDLTGKKVKSYRAPAFSITESNKWAIGVLADCGIEHDASIFPISRDFGGYPSFPCDKPCKIDYQGSIIKEFPVSVTSFFGKQFVYSGGGYFRIIPYWSVKRIFKKEDYNICYFHLSDLLKIRVKLMNKQAYESYFKEPGTIKNRLVRFAKSNLGRGDAFGKLIKLMSDYEFVNISEASNQIDWNKVETVYFK